MVNKVNSQTAVPDRWRRQKLEGESECGLCWILGALITCLEQIGNTNYFIPYGNFHYITGLNPRQMIFIRVEWDWMIYLHPASRNREVSNMVQQSWAVEEPSPRGGHLPPLHQLITTRHSWVELPFRHQLAESTLEESIRLEEEKMEVSLLFLFEELTWPSQLLFSLFIHLHVEQEKLCFTYHWQ